MARLASSSDHHVAFWKIIKIMIRQEFRLTDLLHKLKEEWGKSVKYLKNELIALLYMY